MEVSVLLAATTLCLVKEERAISRSIGLLMGLTTALDLWPEQYQIWVGSRTYGTNCLGIFAYIDKAPRQFVPLHGKHYTMPY